MGARARAGSGDPVVLDLPFTGRWRAINSPARRIPSHGTHAFGSSHAIDFVPVDQRGRSVPSSWRNLVAPILPERFSGFGRPILAPVAGEVVAVHDGEPDHEGRVSQLLLVGYLLSQGQRARRGAAGLAGNHIIIACGGDGPFVVLAHLRRDSLVVRFGDVVQRGQRLAECGNSGNSTEPHLHVQVSDRLEMERAQGIPIAFRDRCGRVFLPIERAIVTG